ncbi:MAG TPA: putative LPS assembly protein LptD [Hanamia sp.]|nr:putative LPS assembly protein LptD [Hanamia sp.]
MRKKYKFRSKNLSTFAFIAILFVFLIFTIRSKGKIVFNKISPFNLSDQLLSIIRSDSIPKIHSKENHFSVAEKRNFETDTIPTSEELSIDTIPGNQIDSLSKNDSLLARKKADTIHYKLAKNALEAPIDYTAEDSMVIDVKDSKVTLYGKKVTVKYKDNNLTGPVVSFDEKSGDIVASIKRDSTGKVISFPTFKQADFTSQMDTVKFNLKSGKGLTKSTYTQQGQMYVYAKVIKKVSPEVFYALRGRFTTCDLDTPHFAFISNKIKFITNKVAISGPVHPEVEGVPIPIYFPFGIFPLNSGRHSGFLPPNFTVNQQEGIGLEGLGYYKVINDYWDFVIRSSIYSYGGWSLNFNPRYSKRYHYSGNLSLNIIHFNVNAKGDPDFSKTRAFQITWSHSADTKSRPGVTFSANVDAGSSSYNSLVPNNTNLNYQNQLSSSIAYSKTWQGSPFSLTLTANHNQNTLLKLFNVSLPTLGFTMTTIYPFRRKDAVGPLKWYENLGIGYTLNAQNRFSFYDTVKNRSIFQQIGDTLQWGAHHTIPITLSLPQMGVFQLAPSVSYDETWYQNKVSQSWNSTRDTLNATKIQKGFYAARQMSFGLSVTTKIYGMFASKKKDAKIIAIRHLLTPTFGISYQPNFNRNNYYTVQTDSFGNKSVLPYYAGGYNIYSAYTNGRFGGFNFGLNNNLSMKVRSKKDTGKNAIKKISLLDVLSINGSYNLFPVDFHHFSNFSANASTNLFNKVNITANANFDPYRSNEYGIDTSILIWKTDPISLGRLTNASISLSSSFKGGNKQTGDKSGVKPGESPPPVEPGYDQDQLNSNMAYIRNNPGEYADFNIPWSVNLSYSFALTKQFIYGSGFKSNFSQNLNFSGTLNITPKWQMAINGFYNVSLGQLNPLTMSMSRDLHCWQMSINVTPLGIYRYFSINLSPKSSLLQDLKINRTRSFYSGPTL